MIGRECIGSPPVPCRRSPNEGRGATASVKRNVAVSDTILDGPPDQFQATIGISSFSPSPAVMPAALASASLIGKEGYLPLPIYPRRAVHSTGRVPAMHRCSMARRSSFPMLTMPNGAAARATAAPPGARQARTQGPAWHFGASTLSCFISMGYNAPNDAPFGASPSPIAAGERRCTLPCLTQPGGGVTRTPHPSQPEGANETRNPTQSALVGEVAS